MATDASATVRQGARWPALMQWHPAIDGMDGHTAALKAVGADNRQASPV
jgi:hypothetical protein